MAFAAAVGATVYAQAGVALFFLRWIFGGFAPRPRGWLALWWIALLPVAVLEAGVGHYRSAGLWLVQAVFGTIAGWVLRGRSRVVRNGLMAGLVSVSAVLTVTQAGAGFVWNRSATDDATFSLARHWLTGAEVLTHRVSRSWAVPAGAASVSFEGDLKALTEGGAWNWHPNGSTQIAPLAAAGPDAARITFGTAGDPYAERWVDLGSAVGGHTFRATAELRAAAPIPARGCRGIWLQAWGKGGGGTCQAVAVGTAWQARTLTWTAPPTARTHVIRLVLNDFDGHAIDVRQVHLEERAGGGWKDLGPLAPAGDQVTITRTSPSGTASRTVTLAPGSTWKRVAVSLGQEPTAHATAPGTDTLTVSIAPDSGSRLAIRSAHVRVAGGRATVKTEIFRQALWFGHPNLAGHSIAASALAALALPASLPFTIVVLVVGLVAVFMTGSRTALLALALGGFALTLLRHSKRKRFIAPTLAVAVLAVLALVALTLDTGLRKPSWLNFNEGQLTPRTAIWSAGAAAFASHPLTGLAGAGTTFEAYWASSPYDHTGERLTHAHDFWLELAARYGLVGVFAALWITGGILLLAWRQGRWVGLALAGSVFFMNVLDYTLLFTGVLVPLLLGLNTLGADDRDPQSATQ